MNEIVWKDNKISRLTLGTAQLGMNYGIANTQGQATKRQAFDIIMTAWEQGVNCFDTAQGYGNSEVILGEALRYYGIASGAKIISKLSPELAPTNSQAIMQSIETSLEALGVEQLWCMMLHRSDWIDKWHDGLGQILGEAKRSGTVRYLGASVYSPEDAKRALENPDIQVVQVPCNAWDQRMLRKGIFELAEENDKLCFVRSIYLQGLLLLSPETVAEKLSAARNASEKWHTLVAKLDIETSELAVRFGLFMNGPLVIGAETVQQVEENALLLRQPPLTYDVIEMIQNEMSILLNNNILNPSLWNIKKSPRFWL